MGVIKNLLAKWTVFLWTLLKPLGAWGVFAIGAIDSALLGMPVDAVVGGYVYTEPHKFWLYVLMASAGSALGSLVVYGIGYEMGELVLEKRMGRERFQRVRARFEKHEFLALAVPALFPPPFPFKLFALSAAVFEMRLTHYLLAIFAGRIARFLALSALVLIFGPQAVSMIGAMFRNYPGLMWGVILMLGGVLLLYVVRRKRKRLATD